MNYNNFLNKILYLLNLNKFYAILILIISILLTLYCIVPSFPSDEIIISFIYIVPFYILYIFFVKTTLENLNFIRMFIYPIILGTLFVCTIKCISIFGNDYAELFFFISIFLFPICLIITEIYAIIQDIKTFRNASLPTDDE